MARFLVKLLLLVPIPLVMMAINFFVDPAHLYSNEEYLRGIGKIMLSGKNVRGLHSFDDHTMRKIYAAMLPQRKQVLVLGSSRCMQISEELFPGRSFHNAWVSGANLQAIVATYQAYVRNNKVPDLIILGCDPWIFNEFIYDRQDEPRVRWEQLLSPSYFQASLLYLWRGASWDYQATDATQDVREPIYLADGSRSEAKAALALTEEQVAAELRKGLSGFRDYIDFPTLSPLLKGKFTDFLDEIVARKTKVIFWLAPFHPVWHEAYFSRPQFVQVPRAEAFFRAVAHARAIPVIGSYHPDRCGIVGADMADGDHLKRVAVQRLFAPALRSSPIAVLLPEPKRVP